MFKNKIMSVEDVFKSSSEKRGFVINLLMCIVTFITFYFCPVIFNSILSTFVKNELLCSTLARILTILLIGFYYYKDLFKEFKELKNKPGSKVGTAFKYYGIGMGVMVVSNLVLLLIFKSIATNETEVRELLRAYPVVMMFTISVIAPLSEELTFRKSLSPLFKNKWLFALTSGVLFGLAHLAVEMTVPGFNYARLLYLIPYGSLGFVFALMDRDTNSTFTSIILHGLHNFASGLLILLSGV